MEVKIPPNFNSTSMYALVTQIFDEHLNVRCSSVRFDFSTLEFIEPVGVVILSNLLESLKKADVKFKIKNHNTRTVANKYLDDAGFFETYTGSVVFKDDHHTRLTTIPLRLVANQDATHFLHAELMPWIGQEVGLSEESLAAVRTSIEEIFHNIRDHSGVGVGCVFAQHFPKKNEIQVAISDFGKGIPNVVRTVKNELNDRDALWLACQEGFSTKSNVRNRGAGLPNLMRYIPQRNGGTILVSSGAANVSATKGAEMPKITARSANGYYPGTLVRAILRTDTFERLSADAEREVFEW